MDVLIAGAGVGGLALARGLLDAGHHVRILERAPGWRADGAAVTIFSNGAAAMSGLGAPLDGIGGSIEELRFCTADGELLYDVDLGPLRRRTGFPVATVPRQQLTDQLASGLPSDLVRFGRAVDSVDLRSGRVEVTDEHGERHGTDVLVGADGVRSVVRSTVVDSASAIDSGWATWQGLGPVLPEIAAGTSGRFLVGDAGFCGLMPAGRGLVQWWFDTRWSRARPSPPSPADWLRERFAGFADPVPALLAGITDADLGLYPHVLHRIPDRWGQGPTTLVGDAAHAFPPTQAQGANQALEDAWLLTRALSRPGDPTASLRRYEALRSRRVRRVARLAATETTNLPPGRFRRAARHLPSRLASSGYVTLVRSWSSVLHDERP